MKRGLTAPLLCFLFDFVSGDYLSTEASSFVVLNSFELGLGNVCRADKAVNLLETGTAESSFEATLSAPLAVQHSLAGDIGLPQILDKSPQARYFRAHRRCSKICRGNVMAEEKYALVRNLCEKQTRILRLLGCTR